MRFMLGRKKTDDLLLSHRILRVYGVRDEKGDNCENRPKNERKKDRKRGKIEREGQILRLTAKGGYKERGTRTKIEMEEERESK